MDPIDYIARITAHYERLGFTPYRWVVNAEPPPGGAEPTAASLGAGAGVASAAKLSEAKEATMPRQILEGLMVACSAALLVTVVVGRVTAQDTPKDLKTLDKLEGYDQLPGETGVKKAMEAVPDQPIETVIVWSAAQPSTGKAPLTVKFSADPLKGANTYEWTFGDGSGPASGATASHTFAKAGTYRVLLKVTGPGGLLGEDEHRIKVAQ